MTTGYRKLILGCLAGGALLVTMMLVAAGLAIGFGWIALERAGQVDLVPWLVLEIAGGAVASVLAGALCRRIAGSYRGPVVLAIAVAGLAILEAMEILSQAAAGSVRAPWWLVLIAPVAAAAGVLLGGWRRRGLRTPG